MFVIMFSFKRNRISWANLGYSFHKSNKKQKKVHKIMKKNAPKPLFMPVDGIFS